MKNIFRVGLLVLFSAVFIKATAQDVRTTVTRVADILAQMPAGDPLSAAAYMDELASLSRAGLDMICIQIVPAGAGNDTPARFAVEGLSRHLSQEGFDEKRNEWEKVCLEWIAKSTDSEVKSFFISQLGYVGSEACLEPMSALLTDKYLAEPAVSVIVAVETRDAQRVLLESLKIPDNNAVVATLNGIAALDSYEVTMEIKSLSTSSDPDVRAAAYRALAVTGSAEAADIITRAARDVSYGWEETGAVASLLVLADRTGAIGNLKGMDKILKQLMSNTTSVQYKSAVLVLKAKYYGALVHKELLKVMKSDDSQYRGAAMRIAAGIDAENYAGKWVTAMKKMGAEQKSEVITMLGERGDKSVIPELVALLSDGDGIVRQAAARNLALLGGKDVIDNLISYLLEFEDGADQDAAASALVTLLDREGTDRLARELDAAGAIAAGTIIGILSWSNNEAYFDDIYKYTIAEDDGLRSSAFIALKNLTSEKNQLQLLSLLGKNLTRQEINEVQLALAASVAANPDKEGRVEQLLQYLKNDINKPFIIPVLSRLGGFKAAEAVLKEFDSGDSSIRDICFEALLYWNDHYALNSLFEIYVSGNKRFGTASFDAYVRQVNRALVPSEQKLLYLKKIQPHAMTIEQKELVLEAAGSIRTYLSLFFVGEYFDNAELAPTAARMAMRIALPTTDGTGGMTGVKVRELLEKSIVHLMGNESDYDKERMRKYLESMPDDEGFVSMFNGEDLTGWQGLVGNPVTRSKMTEAELALKQKESDNRMHENWSVRDGMIWFSGRGDNLCSVKHYGDFELLADWRITRNGDSGIYLRGSPQIQIWDTSRTDVGAQVGSGGLYNNQKHPSKPLVVADNQVGEWNTFRVIMQGEHVSVWLNGILVVDNVVMENYWDRSLPIFPVESIELQAHGTDLAFRDIYIREIRAAEYNLTPEEKRDGFIALFNGRDLDGWVGDKVSYIVEDGIIVIKPQKGSGGNLYTAKEYSDFVFRFEFQLTQGANNGLGIRAPLEGDAAYVGMELQILDNTAPVYANLQPYQYHGSVYGVIPAKRGHLKPVGEWNYQAVVVQGNRVKVTLNGTVIVDGDIADASKDGTIDGLSHPGLMRSEGHIGFLGHGSVVRFRNIRIKEY